MVLANIFLVDLFDRVLVLADDDRWFVYVEQQIGLVHRQVAQRVFFQREIQSGVRVALVIDKQHVNHFRSWSIGRIPGLSRVQTACKCCSVKLTTLII